MPLSSEELRVATRQELLEQVFDGLKAHIGDDFDHLELNRVVLYNVVVSYFRDVDRHKEFHQTALVEQTKQAAFTIKWLAKLRPVQFRSSTEDVTQTMLYVNEVFAVRCGLAFMQISPDVLPQPLYDEILYTLRYRHIDERMLLVWLATLRHATKGEIGPSA